MPITAPHPRPAVRAVWVVLAVLLCVGVLLLPSRWFSEPRSESPHAEREAPAPVETTLAEPPPEQPEPLSPLASPPLESDSGAAAREPLAPERSVPWSRPREPVALGSSPTPAEARSPEPLSRREVRLVSGLQTADAGWSLAPETPLQQGAQPQSPLLDAGAEPAPAEPELPPEPVLPPEPAPQPAPDEEGEACGLVRCAPGTSCCNPSCGVCVALGENCDPEPCESKVQYPFSPICGKSTCNVGQVCCNPSCGTCVAAGESCSHQTCD